MESNAEESLRTLLEQNYFILEQYSKELEQASVKEQRVEEILGQVHRLAEISRCWLLELMHLTSDPLQAECLELSLVCLQSAAAMVEAKASAASRHLVLRQVLYYSKMALL